MFCIEDAFEEILYNYDQIKYIANSYINRRECNVQEFVYHVLSDQWQSKIFPDVIFANSKNSEKRFRLCLRKDEISDSPEDTNEVFKCNMMDHYTDRPSADYRDGKHAALDSMSLAKSLRYYSPC